MKIQCCKCGILIREIPDAYPDMISHSYCPVCYPKAMEEVEKVTSQRNHIRKEMCDG